LLGKPVRNFGVGGEISTQISARAGAVPITCTSATIPTSGAVAITPTPSVPSAQGFAPTGKIKGVRGTFAWNGGTPQFTRCEAGSTVAVASGDLFIPDSAILADYSPLLIWSGRNNPSPASTVLADIKAMIDRNKSGKFLVLSVLNGAGEGNPSTAYTNITSLNSQLAALYGNRFVDVRRYLIDHGLQDAGITPITQDNTDVAADTVPVSLRTDGIHLITAGYTIVAQQVYARMQTLGWA